MGGLAGYAGSLAEGPVSRVIVTLAVALVLVLAGIELAGKRARLLQRDIETPQSWMQFGPVWWPLANGAALGAGVSTRLGFPVWYVIPIAAFATGSPLWGAVAWGLYGFLRTSFAWVLLRRVERDLDPYGFLNRLAASQPVVRRSVALIAVGLSVTLFVTNAGI